MKTKKIKYGEQEMPIDNTKPVKQICDELLNRFSTEKVRYEKQEPEKSINDNTHEAQKECTGASGNKSFENKIYSDYISEEELNTLGIEECKRLSQERKRKAGFKKMGNKIRNKAKARKIITLRTKARLRKFIEKEFPYVQIKDISIDFYHLPEEITKEYFEELNRLRNEGVQNEI